MEYATLTPPQIQTKYKFLESEEKVEHHFPKNGLCACGFAYGNDEHRWADHLTALLFPKL